tara:strand:- start:285 stop:1292 length:1008 start_codon:yes stop_codon:yes gene_type:complete
MGCNLKDLAPSSPIEISDLSGQKVAVDVFLNAYQFITSMTGDDGKPLSYKGKPVSHLMGFLDRASILVSEGIDPIFVFDGRPHDLKRATLDDRKSRKIDAKSRWEDAIKKGDVSSAKKLGPQTAEYTPQMVAQTKLLFDHMGLVWIEAPMEAEGAAAVMCKRGIVGAVASQDWDTLLYGSPVMIRNLTAHGTRKFGRVMQAEMISLDEMLGGLGISQSQLVDLGIMVGTDFHPGIKGIGPKTGLKLIKEHGSMEAVSSFKGFDLPENLEQIRSLFHNHPTDEEPIPESRPAIEEDLVQFLQKEWGFSDARIKRALDRLSSVGKLRSKSRPTLFDF